MQSLRDRFGKKGNKNAKNKKSQEKPKETEQNIETWPDGSSSDDEQKEKPITKSKWQELYSAKTSTVTQMINKKVKEVG